MERAEMEKPRREGSRRGFVVRGPDFLPVEMRGIEPLTSAVRLQRSPI
jgi:hypothetical protein